MVRHSPTDVPDRPAEELEQRDLVRCVLRREAFHPLLAEAVAGYLDLLPGGTRVGIYPPGPAAQALLERHSASLRRHEPVFILTDPLGATTFQGFPLVPPAALRACPPEAVIILSARFEHEMAAELGFMDPVRVVRPLALLEASGLERVLGRARDLIADRVEREAARMAAELPGDRPLVLFLTSHPPHHIVKIMGEAVRQGFAVAVVAEYPKGTSGDPLGAYVGTGCFHSLYVSRYSLAQEFLALERRLKPRLVHLETGMDAAQSIARVVAQKTTPAVVEYRDFPQTVFPTEEAAMKAWRLPPEEYREESDAHRRIFLGADGIIMKDAPETLDFLSGLYGHRPERVLQFYPYFSDDLAAPSGGPKLSAVLGEPHIVYAGAVVDAPGWHNYPIYRSLLAAGRILADQGIHLTIYNANDPGDGRGFEDYRVLAGVCPYFHYHPALPYRELKTVLPRHDFGWLCFDFSQARENPFFHRITMGSKVFTYLEAGLPVLISPEQEFMARVVTRDLGSGVPLAFWDLPQLRRILDRQDWTAVHRRIRAAQATWTYRSHGPRLGAFYHSCAGTRGPGPWSA
ncbi:MAG: hypothetical protein ABSH53_10585 [Holophaga sp.]|jgi:hypothetical protein